MRLIKFSLYKVKETCWITTTRTDMQNINSKPERRNGMKQASKLSVKQSKKRPRRK